MTPAPDVDTFICPECGAARRGVEHAAYHAPACPRALGRSSGRGIDAAALEALGRRLTPSTQLYAVRRGVSNTGTTETIGFVVLKGGGLERITRELAQGLGLEYDAREDGVMLRRDAGVSALVERLSRALYGLEGRLTWQWP